MAMYKIIKTGLTLAGKVWEKGELIDDEFAKVWGVDKWWEESSGYKKQRTYIKKIKPSKQAEAVAEATGEEIKLSDEMQEVEKTVQDKGHTLQSAVGFSWKEACKAFGPGTAKKLKDYGKSIATK